MLICFAVKHEGRATGEEPFCASVALLIKRRQQSTVADSGNQTNSMARMSVKETASGERHRRKETGERRAMAKEDDRMTHRGWIFFFFSSVVCLFLLPLALS